MSSRFVTVFLAMLSAAVFPSYSALFRGRLRGPNICYSYDTGRYCCPGFVQVNGFCILSSAAPKGRQYKLNIETTTPRVRFAHRPYEPKVVSLTKFDEYGRPVGVAYSHGRKEETAYHPNTKNVESINPVGAEDFYIPYDMETVRKRLAEQKIIGAVTTPPPTKRLLTTMPRLRFQSAPTVKPYRPWDNKQDRRTGKVAVGKVGKQYLQAVISSQEVGHQQITNNGDDIDTAAFRRRTLVTRPLVGEETTPTTTHRPTVDDTHNRIYFKKVPIGGKPDADNAIENSWSGHNSVDVNAATTDSNTILFKNCPEGYTSVYSAEERDLCYPTSALLVSADQGYDRAPTRGDAAVACPSGHRLQSSAYGDACVPLDWQPCSGGSDCSHSKQPLVMPIMVSSDCSQSVGDNIPCRNTGSLPGGCLDRGCEQTNALVPSDCQGGGCTNNKDGCGDGGCSDCSQGGCDYPLTGDCVGAGCSEATGGCSAGSCGQLVAAGGGRCLNGATKLGNGLCLCRYGYEGSQCEYKVYEEGTPAEEDVDECDVEGTDGRGPCSYECMNTVGSFKCFCPAGSILAPDGVSCMLITCPKCMHGGYCDTDTNQCVCPTGFTGQICETDIDECAVGGICSQECRNTFGSYACLCRQGYTLLRDGHSCEDWRCYPKCVNGGVCVKNKCVCPEGFKGIICQFNTLL